MAFQCKERGDCGLQEHFCVSAMCTCVYVTVSVYVWVCMCDSICVSNFSVECVLGNQNLVAVGLTWGM